MAVLHTLTAECDAFRQQFEQLANDVDLLAGGLSETQFVWRPDPTRWSVADCIEHLNATARAYLPALDDAIGEAIRRGWYRKGPYRYNVIGRVSVAMMEPPPRVRLRAPKVFEPEPTRGRQLTLNAFRAYQVQYVDRLRQADGLDLARAKVRSPAPYMLLPLQLGSAFALRVAHERRHLWQARAVVESSAFPRA